MQRPKIPIEIHSSHASFVNLIQEVVSRPDIAIGTPNDGLARRAHVLMDFPLTWAMHRLSTMDSIDRAKTLVITQATHPAYLDCIASFHVSGVAQATDEHAVLAGFYAAAASQRTYQYKSPLTYMELRVVRLLLTGSGTNEIAASLGISFKTVNAHVSNVLAKLGCESRTQLVVSLLDADGASTHP